MPSGCGVVFLDNINRLLKKKKKQPQFHRFIFTLGIRKINSEHSFKNIRFCELLKQLSWETLYLTNCTNTII